MQKIKVSIIVPIYNMQKYLKQCLDSIISQSLEEIEIICVNDGSTDSSKEILEEYKNKQKDKKEIIIINKNNTGYGDTMNIGLSQARGEYIGIVESDDFVDKKMFEDLYNLAKANDSDIVKSDWYDYWTESGKSIKQGKLTKFKNRSFNPRECKSLFRIKPTIWSAIYKKELLNSNNIRFLNTPGASYQDTSFWFKALSLANKITLTDKAYLYYRQDNSNSSVKNSGKIYCLCEEYDEINKFLDSNLNLKKNFNIEKLINQYFGYLWNLERIAPEFQGEFLDKFSSVFNNALKNKEINNEFFKKVDKKRFSLLLKNKEKYLKTMKNDIKKRKWKNLRRHILSIKINKKRLSLKLLGKQILEI